MSQTGKHVAVRYKVEATLNTAPGAASGYEMRLTPSQGLSLVKAAIRSQEIRSDGLTTIARHGSRRVEGSFNGELSEGAFDQVFQAVMRSTAVTAVAVTQATASLASITFGTNTVTATNTSAGSGFLQGGIRIGDVFTVTGTSTANDNLNAQVVAVATHTITVRASTFTVVTTAQTTFALTVGKKLKNGTSPTRRSFYVDQYYSDIDVSEVFGGVRWTGMRIRGTPDGMANVEITALGMSAEVLASGSSPYYTNPTTYTAGALTFADAVLMLGNTQVTVATSFDINIEIASDTLPVIGSSITPNVYDNDLRVSGSFTVAREDLARVSAFINETELALHILLEENETAPKGYIGLFIPKIKYMGAAADLGSDGAMVETIPFEAGLKESATGYDQTMLTLTTSAS